MFRGIHHILSSPMRREILLFLAGGKRYLSEIAEHTDRAPQTVDFHLRHLIDAGLVFSSKGEGKVFYELTDKSILKFLRDERPMPHKFHPKPPHEVMEAARAEILEKLAGIEKRLEKIEKKLG